MKKILIQENQLIEKAAKRIMEINDEEFTILKLKSIATYFYRKGQIDVLDDTVKIIKEINP